MQQDHPPAPSFPPLASPWPEGGGSGGQKPGPGAGGGRMAPPWPTPGLLGTLLVWGSSIRTPPKAGAAVISRGRGGGFLMRLAAEMNIN